MGSTVRDHPGALSRLAGGPSNAGPASQVVLVGLGICAVLLPRVLLARPVTSLVALAVLLLGAVMLTRLALCLAVLVAASPFENYLSLHVSPLAVKALGLVVFSAYGLRLLAGAERRAPRHAGMAALLTFTLLLLAATTAHPNGGAGLSTTSRYLSFVVLTVTLVGAMREGGAPRLLLGALVGSAAAAALFALQTFLQGSPRAGGPLEDPNDLAFFLAVAVPLAVALSARSRPAYRFLWLGSAVVLLAGVAFTLSRGALFALAVLLVWALLRRLVKPVTLLAGGMALVLAVGAVAASSPALVDRALSQKSSIGQRNIDTRTLRWSAAAAMTADDPLLGKGPAGFNQNYRYYVSQARPDDATDVVAHEMYLEIAAELGLPALLAFLAALAFAFRACRRVERRPQRRPHDSRHAASHADAQLALGVHGALIVACTAALFLTEQYYLPIWALMAAAFALELRQRDRHAADRTDSLVALPA